MILDSCRCCTSNVIPCHADVMPDCLNSRACEPRAHGHVATALQPQTELLSSLWQLVPVAPSLCEA